MAPVSFFIVSGLGWRIGLQAIAGIVTSTSLLAIMYRPASIYHPQRRAISHLKQHMRLLRISKTKNKKKKVLHTKVLRSRTVRIILLSAAVCAMGHHAPFFLIATQARSQGLSEMNILWMQIILGLGYSCGCYVCGRLLLIKHGDLTQYVCQAVLLVCGLGMVLSSMLRREGLSDYLVFVLLYGLCAGGSAATLKVFVYKRARSRFATVWSLVMMVQAIPNTGSVALIAFINQQYEHGYGFIIGGLSVIMASICLFIFSFNKFLNKRKEREVNKSETCKKHSLEDRDEMSIKYLENIGAMDGSNICNEGKIIGINNFLNNISSCNKVILRYLN